jgi:hypothetical protein
MNRTFKVSLMIVGIFACGVVVGGFGAKRFIQQQPPRPAVGGGADNFGPNILRRLTAELELTEQQRAAIEPIISGAGERLRTLRQESMRESGAVIEAMNAAVTAELTPAQKEKFAVLKEAQKARMKAFFEERQRRRTEGGERDRDRERGRGGEPRRPPPERVSPPDEAAPPREP